MKTGKLYICPTPIGNLEDITIRTLNVLKEVDLIAAEDTRRSIKLLNHYEIKNPLTSYHEHNEISKGEYLIDKLNQGRNIALISDAGMPGISDPGEKLIKMAIENGIEVIGLPGPTASILGLILSGLDTEKFFFEGFLPSKKQDRIKRLEKIKDLNHSLIFYESPYRIKDSLKDMGQVLGNRQVSISRELTKKYEETLRGKIETVLGDLVEEKVRGEFVIVVEGSNIEVKEEEIDIEKVLLDYINDGLSKSKAVKKVSTIYGIPRNRVYDISLKL